MKILNSIGEFGYLGYQVALKLPYALRDRKRNVLNAKLAIPALGDTIDANKGGVR